MFICSPDCAAGRSYLYDIVFFEQTFDASTPRAKRSSRFLFRVFRQTLSPRRGYGARGHSYLFSVACMTLNNGFGAVDFDNIMYTRPASAV